MSSVFSTTNSNGKRHYVHDEIWVDEPTDDQQTQQAKKKAPSQPQEHKKNDYCTQDIIIDVVAEVIRVVGK